MYEMYEMGNWHVAIIRVMVLVIFSCFTWEKWFSVVRFSLHSGSWEFELDVDEIGDSIIPSNESASN